MPVKLAHTVNSALYPLGLQVRRLPYKSSDFYPVVNTCQLQYLSEKYEQFFGRRQDGQFVEVGAYDGVSYSNSWGLAERNWSGLLIEPIEEYADRCRRNHSQHPAVRVIQTAISADESGLTFNVAGAHTTASADQMSEFEQGWGADTATGTSVQTTSRTLDAVLDEAGMEPGFEVLIVDVEGHESSVFAGFDLARWRPQMMIVELADSHTHLTAVRQDHASLYRTLLEAGYIVVHKDVINTMLLRDDVYEKSMAAAVAR